MEAEQFDFSVVFPNIAAQLRSVLGNLHLAAAQLAPAIRREGDPALDSTASLLDQSYYRLLRLVNNLMAAGELGQDAPLPVRDRDLTETVRAVCAGAQGLFALKKVQLEFRSAADCHTCAFHQPSIELLLYQLLSNALKFTPAGGAVTVELKFINRWVRLSVSDTGCGIQEDQIPFLFDRYLHDDAMAPQPHGLGLGLPICQHIAERHGGTMIAESRPGQGSRFTLSLPDRRCGTADVTTAASIRSSWPWRTPCPPRLSPSAIWTDPGSGWGRFFSQKRLSFFPEIGYNSPITRPALRRPFQEEPIYVPACICGHERRRGQRRGGAAAAAGRL